MRNFILFPALAMSVAWGFRGFIGGGPLGAMIPGALAALALAAPVLFFQVLASRHTEEVVVAPVKVDQ